MGEQVTCPCCCKCFDEDLMVPLIVKPKAYEVAQTLGEFAGKEVCPECWTAAMKCATPAEMIQVAIVLCRLYKDHERLNGVRLELDDLRMEHTRTRDALRDLHDKMKQWGYNAL